MKMLYRRSKSRIKTCLGLNIRFSSISRSSVQFISAGILSADINLVSYLIEWHKDSIDGVIVLKTGLNHPDISLSHPIKEPIYSGIYYAVLRYIQAGNDIYENINGSTYKNGVLDETLTDMSTCLGSVSIDALTCYNGNISGDFDHSIKYTFNNVIDDEILASRKIQFILSEDGSTNFMAVRFIGYEVADRLIIKYIRNNDEQNAIIISDWAVGTDITNDNFVGNPMQYDENVINLLLDLSKYNYQAGDYLTIQVLPRIQAPANSTNWDLYLKCLNSISCYEPNSNVCIFDDTSLILDNTDPCNFLIRYRNKDVYDFNAMKYISILYLHSPWYINKESGIGEVVFSDTRNYALTSSFFEKVCQQSSGNININQVGNIVTLTFENINDYNVYKNSFDSIPTEVPAYNDYINDNTKIEYVAFYEISFKVGTLCGDNDYDIYFRFSRQSPISFDSINKTISITITTPTYNIPTIEGYCFDNIAFGNALLLDIQNSINYPILNTDSHILYAKPFDYIYTYELIVTSLEKTVITAIGVKNIALLDACKPVHLEDNSNNNSPYFQGNNGTSYTVTSSWLLYIFSYLKITILDKNDPLNNIRIRCYNDTSGNVTGNPAIEGQGTIIYEVINGVRTV